MEFLRWCRLQWDRVGAVLAVATGGVFLVVGWAKVSGTPYAAGQIPVVVSCGLGGIFMLGLGAMLWHSADLRDQWRKLDRLEEEFQSVVAAVGNWRRIPSSDGDTVSVSADAPVLSQRSR